MKKCLFLAALVLLSILVLPYTGDAQAPGIKSYIATSDGAGYFPLSSNGKSAPIYAGESEYPGVVRAIKACKQILRR